MEDDFAIDSTGFATTTYSRWFDYKWGREIKETMWVKAHVMCVVKTNIVTDCEATTTPTGDAPYLAPFVATTARHFDVNEVSGDKAYLSRPNLQAVHDAGGVAYIPFKSNSVASHYRRNPDALWDKAFHFYNLHRDEFLEHYHKRSNVESTFSMIKAKFGPSVRSKTPVAQVNEVMVKTLCHNICVLILSMYSSASRPSSAWMIPG